MGARDIRFIVGRFPRRELDIHRRCARDPQFLAICSDYEEAMRALIRWQDQGTETDPRIREYTDFLHEIETEILLHLDHAGPAG